MKMNSDLNNKRNYLVVKGNELIQKSRFELSLPEQRTVAFICSLIKPVNKENEVPFQLEYEFNIREYCKVCGISYDSGKNYAEVKEILKRLRDRSMWLVMSDGSESLVGWLAKVNTNKKSGIAKIKIDEDLVPYLFDLGQRFTQYQLKNILGMKSAFSVRIYELMKSYAFQKTKIFEIEELKSLLMVENVKSYKNFKDFRRFVLEKAQEEINELTDINIHFEPISRGRGGKVVEVKFIVEKKNSLDRAIAELKTDNKLNEMTR